MKLPKINVTIDNQNVIVKSKKTATILIVLLLLLIITIIGCELYILLK